VICDTLSHVILHFTSQASFWLAQLTLCYTVNTKNVRMYGLYLWYILVDFYTFSISGDEYCIDDHLCRCASAGNIWWLLWLIVITSELVKLYLHYLEYYLGSVRMCNFWCQLLPCSISVSLITLFCNFYRAKQLCKRSLGIVILSVCLSVRHARALWRNERTYSWNFDTT